MHVSFNYVFILFEQYTWVQTIYIIYRKRRLRKRRESSPSAPDLFGQSDFKYKKPEDEKSSDASINLEP